MQIRHEIPNESCTWYVYRPSKSSDVVLYYAEADENGTLVLCMELVDDSVEQSDWWKNSNLKHWMTVEFPD